MTKIRKRIAAIAAAAVMGATMVSGACLNASAYAPTITKQFGVGSTYATADLYRDSSQASARVILSGASALSVSVSVNGTVSRTTYDGSAASGYKSVVKTGSNITYARGSYSASKNGSSGSTSLSC